MHLKTMIQAGGVCMLVRGGVEIEAVADGKIAVSHHPYTGDMKAFAHFPDEAKVTIYTEGEHMLCSSCKQPMVDPDDGALINGTAGPYSGRLCLDCKAARNHTPTEELDCWEYLNRRQLQWKLRDAAQLRMGAI